MRHNLLSGPMLCRAQSRKCMRCHTFVADVCSNKTYNKSKLSRLEKVVIWSWGSSRATENWKLTSFFLTDHVFMYLVRCHWQMRQFQGLVATTVLQWTPCSPQKQKRRGWAAGSFVYSYRGQCGSRVVFVVGVLVSYASLWYRPIGYYHGLQSTGGEVTMLRYNVECVSIGVSVLNSRA